MIRDLRFGALVGWIGIVVCAVGILGFNIATFPTPPIDAGLVDPGPITGLWYLAVVIMLVRAMRSEARGGIESAPA